jgi:hypothetical protein
MPTKHENPEDRRPNDPGNKGNSQRPEGVPPGPPDEVPPGPVDPPEPPRRRVGRD